MILKPWFAAVLAAVALAGCAQLTPASRSHRVCNGAQCIVDVAPGAHHDAVPDPEELEIKGQRNVHIFWKLAEGYEFNTALGDGIYLKFANDGEFTEMFETDTIAPNPAPAHRPAPHYHWRDANSRANPNPYHYKIQFHKKGSATEVYFKDPIIINSGGPEG